MTARYTRPDLVRRLNAMGSACGGAGYVVPIDADELIRAASLSTGLEEFGGLGDGDWERRFRALVDAVNGCNLHVVGRLMTREELLRSLRTRLLLADHRRRHPAIGEEEIRAPIVVTGPARSGTTILFELLGLDPALRTPIAADVLHPVVPDDLAPAERLAMTECEQELWADVQPEFASMHELRADLPVECVYFSGPSFAGHHWASILSSWGDWMMDLKEDLRFHRCVLQTVQFGGSRRTWLLKTPAWLLAIDDLLAAYADARLVVTHRDPARTIPSNASISTMTRWIRSDDGNAEEFADLIRAVFTGAQTEFARRHAAGSIPAPVANVRYTDLLGDPVATVRTIYDTFELPWPNDHETTISSYLTRKPKGKHGSHGYSAADWHLDPVSLRSDLTEYIEHFRVELEELPSP